MHTDRDPKDNNSADPRPIAIGETILKACTRAIIDKVLKFRIDKKMSLGLSPNQFGVKVRGGVEVTCHAIRELYLSKRIAKIITIDATSAFNHVSRTCMLNSVDAIVPELSSVTSFLYRPRHSWW